MFLHRWNTIAAVACHVQVGAYQHGIVRFKAEIAMHGIDESTHRNQRGCNEHSAERDLHSQQNVSGSNLLPNSGAGPDFDDLICISAKNLPDRNRPEQEPGDDAQ